MLNPTPHTMKSRRAKRTSMEPQQKLRQDLRKQLRQRRRSLSPQQQQQAAQQLCKRLKRQPLFLRSKHIALYLPNDGEIDPRPLITEAWRRGKCCYLPVLEPSRENRLWFVRYTPDTALIQNRFGIAEPKADYQQRFSVTQLDLIVMPLVGFDTQGGRMGMGGGFYDRSLAFKHGSNRQKPYLLGLAHQCQQVDELELAHWDIPLNAVATDKAMIIPPGKASHRDFF